MNVHGLWVSSRMRAWGWMLSLAVLAGCASRGPVPQGEAGHPTVEAPAVKRAPKFGLALGGGAARGFAHVGVIQVLEEAGIQPDLVVGTSAGSLVAALYASGKNSATIARFGKITAPTTSSLPSKYFSNWNRNFTHNNFEMVNQ